MEPYLETNDLSFSIFFVSHRYRWESRFAIPHQFYLIEPHSMDYTQFKIEREREREKYIYNQAYMWMRVKCENIYCSQIWHNIRLNPGNNRSKISKSSLKSTISLSSVRTSILIRFIIRQRFTVTDEKFWKFFEFGLERKKSIFICFKNNKHLSVLYI